MGKFSNAKSVLFFVVCQNTLHLLIFHSLSIAIGRRVLNETASSHSSGFHDFIARCDKMSCHKIFIVYEVSIFEVNIRKLAVTCKCCATFSRAKTLRDTYPEMYTSETKSTILSGWEKVKDKTRTKSNGQQQKVDQV